MELFKLIIFALVVSGIECRSRVLEKTFGSDKVTRLTDTAIDTMLSCYENEVSTVGAALLSDSTLHKILFSKQSFAMALISDDTAGASATNGKVDRGSRHRLQLFVVETSSPAQLNRTVLRIKRTKWWNHMAKYLIIDRSSEEIQGCSKAFDYLWTAWTRDLLNAWYVCYDKSEEKVLVYTYNPFTSQAPSRAWRLENTYKGKMDHPWALFVRGYQPDKRENCVDLNFDKTHDIGGYSIECSVRMGADGVADGAFINNLAAALKISLRFLIYSTDSFKGWTDGKGRDLAMDAVEGKSDIILNLRSNSIDENYTFSSNVGYSGLHVVTQFRGQKSQMEKIIAVLDRSTRIGLCVVAVVTLLFFKYCMRQPLGTAILNVMRIVTASCLVKLPKRVAPRLYLAGVLFLVVTIVGIYQGLIASLLTKPSPLPDIETMDDLVASENTIHGHKSVAKIFADSKFNDRFKGNDFLDCSNFVLRNPSAACITSYLQSIIIAVRLKLHKSKSSIFPVASAFIIRDDWPLEERLNAIIASFTESHITWYLRDRIPEWADEIAEYHANWEMNNPPFKAISLSELGFSFVILGIGLVLSTVCFMIEVGIFHLCSSPRFRNMSRSVRRRLIRMKIKVVRRLRAILDSL